MQLTVATLLAITGACVCAHAHARNTGPPGRTSLVGFETREYADESRRNWQNNGPRPLRTVVWYPAAAGSPMEVPAIGDPALRSYFVQRPVAVGAPLSSNSQRYPLVVMSHGSTSVNLALAWLGMQLASRGYIAAAGHSAGGATVIMLAGGQYSRDEMGKFCSSTRADAGCEPRALIEKAIAEVVAMRTQDPVVAASFERAGHSFRDERIRAVLAMAPAIGPGFTPGTLRAIKVPVFVVTAKEDFVTPADTNARWCAGQIPGARLWVVPGNAGHMTFGSECTDEGRRALEVCRDGESLDRGRVHTPS